MVKTEKVFAPAMIQNRSVKRLFGEYNEKCCLGVDNSNLKQNVDEKHDGSPQSHKLSTVKITKSSGSQDSLFSFDCSIIEPLSGRRGDY